MAESVGDLDLLWLMRCHADKLIFLCKDSDALHLLQYASGHRQWSSVHKYLVYHHHYLVDTWPLISVLIICKIHPTHNQPYQELLRNLCYEKSLGKYPHSINWPVPGLMWLELIRGNKTDNTKLCERKSDGEEGGRGLMFTMLWSLWGAQRVDWSKWQ